MANLKVLNEIPISLITLKSKLEAIQKRDKELGNRATKTVEYLNSFVTTKAKEAEGLKEKIINLNI